MDTYAAGGLIAGGSGSRIAAAPLLAAIVVARDGYEINSVLPRAKAPADSLYYPPDPVVGQLWPLEVEVDEMIQIYSPVAIGDITGLQAALDAKAAIGFTGNEVVSYEAATALLQYRAVVINSSGKAIYADNTINAHGTKVLGITLEAAAAPGDAVNIRNYGQVENALWSWVLDTPIYLDTDGQLTQTAPTSGFRLQVAFPISPIRIFIDINDPVYLSGGGSWNYNEVPMGLINGFNNTFTTANAYISGKTIVFLNGVR